MVMRGLLYSKCGWLLTSFGAISEPSGVSASYLTNGHEYWMPMDPIYYHEKSCCFRNTYTRCPLFKRRVKIGFTEPRQDMEELIGRPYHNYRQIKCCHSAARLALSVTAKIFAMADNCRWMYMIRRTERNSSKRQPL